MRVLIKRLLLALSFSAAFGVLGGALLAGPFWFFGALAGPLYAIPVGLGIGVLAWAMDLPAKSIFVACACQCLGAVATGFGVAWLRNDLGPPDVANEGQILGAVVGVVVGIWLRPTNEDKNLKCARCGYDLRGLPEARCPECGTPFAQNQEKDEGRSK